MVKNTLLIQLHNGDLKCFEIQNPEFNEILFKKEVPKVPNIFESPEKSQSKKFPIMSLLILSSLSNGFC